MNTSYSPFDHRHSIFLAAPALALLAYVPSFFLTRIAAWAYAASGNDPSGMVRTFTDSLTRVILGKVLLVPLVETLLMAAGILLLSKALTNRASICILSGLAWGTLHLLNGPLAFLGAAWSFFVFSWAFLAWRPTGLSNALGVAWLAHSGLNALVLVVGLISSYLT